MPKSDRSEPVVVHETFPVSQADLWKAITVRDHMVRWFFGNIPEFEAQEGFSTRFPVDTGVRTFTHLWKIIEVDPGRKIVYEWSYEEYPGRGYVTFEIGPDAKGSRLTLTNTGLETFNEDIPEFRRESCEGGWNYFISEQLKTYLQQSDH